MAKWIDEFGVECDGVEYHKEIADRFGPADVTLFAGTKHYPKSGKDIIWHELYTVFNYDGHCRIDYVRARDALTGFDVLTDFAALRSENKAIKQLCTDEWGTCGWMTVQEMVAGHLRKTVALDQANIVSLKVKA